MAVYKAALPLLLYVFPLAVATTHSAVPDLALPRSLPAHSDISFLNQHELALDSTSSRRGLSRAGKTFFSSHQVKAASTSNNSSTPSSNRNSTSSSSSSCEATYGVLPCTDTVIGNLFLLAAYGYLLFVAAKLLSLGSELLLTVLDAGIIGGLLLPILGALPDSILILGTHSVLCITLHCCTVPSRKPSRLLVCKQRLAAVSS